MNWLHEMDQVLNSQSSSGVVFNLDCTLDSLVEL